MIELFLAALTAAHPPDDLSAAAAASGRPVECLPQAAKSGAASVWTTARVPNLTQYCIQLSRAHARLLDSPDAAKEAANRAEALIPNRSAPQVVLARAALGAGDATLAMKHFDEALKRDPRAIEQPAAMHDLARARLMTGDLTGALAAYRLLVPRASLLASRTERARVLLEAAHLSMVLAARESDAPNLEEALAYLREATHDPHHSLRLDVALSLVLALDRAGRSGPADAILAEQKSSASWAGSASYVVSPHDKLLLSALAAERHAPAKAAELYRQYLDGEGGKGPYAAAARARAGRLGAKGTR